MVKVFWAVGRLVRMQVQSLFLHLMFWWCSRWRFAFLLNQQSNRALYSHPAALGRFMHSRWALSAAEWLGLVMILDYTLVRKTAVNMTRQPTLDQGWFTVGRLCASPVGVGCLVLQLNAFLSLCWSQMEQNALDNIYKTLDEKLQKLGKPTKRTRLNSAVWCPVGMHGWILL